MEIIDLGEPAEAADERVPLFQIGGTTYDIPANPPLGVAVRYLQRAVRGAGLVAEMALLEELLTPEGYRALSERSIKQEQLQALINAAEKHVLGPLERQGNPQSGSEKSAG